MTFSRSCGILLHPTSLPGPFGIGDLGREAGDFVEMLKESGQTLWQILPVSPPGYGNSPYQTYSVFAGNEWLISPALLVEEGLLSKDDLNTAPEFEPGRVDYPAVAGWKQALFQESFERFNHGAFARIRETYDKFCEHHGTWLEDYALYRALKQEHGGIPWYRWPKGYVKRDPAKMKTFREKKETEVRYRMFLQFMFFRQWESLKRRCAEADVKLIGDLPIFVAYDSADVWARPDLFRLDAQGKPEGVAGVPPDYFSATGQRWGNPLYRWDVMESEGFEWWVRRFTLLFSLVDIVRVDHFRGFSACWEIPASEPNAIHGSWIETPGAALFTSLREKLGKLPLIAEDLGVITPDVEALRDRFGFPGMKILQFAFHEGADAYRPHTYDKNCVVYTGTHDNNTTRGWFEAGEEDVPRALEYLGTNGEEIHWDMIRLALSSVAVMAVYPLQDVLGLGAKARMNTPGTPTGNWEWRVRAEQLLDFPSERLRHLTRMFGR